MSKLLKERMAHSLNQEMKEVDSFIAFGFNKMTAEQAFFLRNHLREQNIRVKIIKNKIASVTFHELYESKMGQLLLGPTAIAFGGVSTAEIAKTLIEWNKKNKVIDIKGGYLPGCVLSRKEVEGLSKIPPKPVLLASLAGAIKSPITKIATIIKAPLRDFSYALHAYIEKQEKQGVGA